MVILLPAAVDGLNALEEGLNKEKLLERLAALDKATKTETWVLLPKFKLNCRLDLRGDLALMGMPSAFLEKAANFSDMCQAEHLFLSAAVHQAFVEVAEQGTEAGAASLLGASNSLPPLIRVDHPFLFLIRENQTGAIVFLGRLVDPTN
jgi:serpin B